MHKIMWDECLYQLLLIAVWVKFWIKGILQCQLGVGKVGNELEAASDSFPFHELSDSLKIEYLAILEFLYLTLSDRWLIHPFNDLITFLTVLDFVAHHYNCFPQYTLKSLLKIFMTLSWKWPCSLSSPKNLPPWVWPRAAAGEKCPSGSLFWFTFHTTNHNWTFETVWYFYCGGSHFIL